jgi:hypothetical protein
VVDLFGIADTRYARVSVGPNPGVSDALADCRTRDSVDVHLQGFSLPPGSTKGFQWALTTNASLVVLTPEQSAAAVRQLNWTRVGLSQNLSVPCTSVANSAVNAPSMVVLSPPFRSVLKNSVGNITVVPTVAPSQGVVTVTWSVSSSDSVFGVWPRVRTLQGSVTCSWSLVAGPTTQSDAPQVVPANTSITLPLTTIPPGDAAVVVSCMDTLGRTLAGRSPAFRRGNPGPFLREGALVVSVTRTAATAPVGDTTTGMSAPRVPLPSTLTDVSVCGPGSVAGGQAGVAGVLRATLWPLPSVDTLASTNVTATWAGIAGGASLDPVATYVADLRVGGRVVATAPPCDRCASVTFPAALAFSAMHGGAAAYVPRQCVQGLLTIGITVTDTANRSSFIESAPFVVDPTPPFSLPGCVPAAFCDADSATTSTCDPVAWLRPDAAAVAGRVNTSCFVDAESLGGVVQHRLVSVGTAASGIGLASGCGCGCGFG